MFRTVADVPAIRASMTQLAPLVGIEEILDVPPVMLRTVPGFETATFPYTTDIPFLSAWGTPLLYGPGSIHVAHTDREHVRIGDLKRAVKDYQTLAKQLSYVMSGRSIRFRRLNASDPRLKGVQETGEIFLLILLASLSVKPRKRDIAYNYRKPEPKEGA